MFGFSICRIAECSVIDKKSRDATNVPSCREAITIWLQPSAAVGAAAVAAAAAAAAAFYRRQPTIARTALSNWLTGMSIMLRRQA